MKKLLLFILGGLLATTGIVYAAGVLNSNQVGTNPVNGYYLQTNGATSTWAAVASGSSSQWTTTSTGIFYNGGSVGIGNTDNLANFSGSSTIAWDYNDYLNAASNLAFTATSTQIQISNVTGLAPSGLVQLNGTEIAYYSSFTSAGASSTLNGMTRNLFGTAAVSATGTVNAITNITANDSSHLPTYAVECLSATSCNYAWNSAGLGNSGSQFVFQGQTYNQGAFLATNVRSVSGNYLTNSTAVPLTLQIGTAATSSEFTIASGTAYVGIGTTTPATELEVYGTSSFMGGNVGIGTTTPATKLDVNGDITDRNLISSPFLATNATGTLIAGTILGTANGGTNTSTALGTYAFLSSGLPSIATTSKTIYDMAPSSTDDIPFNIDMQATTTLNQVECVNDNTSGNTDTFNITWGTSRSSATSNAFTSPVTCTSITTPTIETITGSSTIPAGSIIRLVNSAASSTGITVQIEY